jgi:uncharacterized protein YeaO (DUF488 family)
MAIALKRAYEAPAASDGFRVLVDRLWPRGVSKEDAKIDLWIKDAAPSTELRRWFAHESSKWPEFKKRYYGELRACGNALDPLLERVRTGKGRVTFVFSSKEERYNNAAALKEYVERRVAK